MIKKVNFQLLKTVNGKTLGLNRFRNFGLITWSVIVAGQWLWWFGQQDILMTLLTIAGGSMGIIVFLKKKFLDDYPISTLMVLGYVSYYFLLPPIATFIENKPLSHNLLHPTLVLFHGFVCLLSLICAHTIYRYSHLLQSLRWFISQKIYQPLGFFRSPSNLHLLLMGIVGLIAMAIQVFIVGAYQEEELGVINKLIQGFYPLAYLPYVLLVKKLIGLNSRLDRKWLLLLIAYSILIVIVSIGRNSRATLFIGIASIILAYSFGLARGIYKINKSALWKIVLGLIIVLVISGPISDLALSMVVVRGTRTDISASELVSETIKVYLDKDGLNSYRIKSVASRSVWDEWYVDNLFLARLSNLKYADNSLDSALSMGRVAKNFIQEIEKQRIFAIYPRPLINFLGLPVEKDIVTSASSGDFMYYAATGYSYVLGGYRTGSIFGNGYLLFGWYYPIVFSILVLLISPLADALTSKKTQKIGNQSRSEGIPLLSPMVIVGLFSWFFYLTSAATGAESLSDLVSYLLRGWIQTLFIYVLIYWVTYIPLRLISRKIV